MNQESSILVKIKRPRQEFEKESSDEESNDNYEFELVESKSLNNK